MFRAPIAVLVASAFLLTGCSSVPIPTLSFPDQPVFGGTLKRKSISSGSDSSFLFDASSNTGTAGYVVGDEPFAVKAGQRILEEGGTAADAAAAIYFALSVTYPVAAGLGGGGICIVSDPQSGRGEVFDFLPRNSSSGVPYAVPGNVRGFGLVQAVYGTLPWQRVVSPGEGYAATGVPISRALAERLEKARDVIRADAGLTGIYLDMSGVPRQAGTIAANPALAITLGEIRLRGASVFYEGTLGGRIAASTGIVRGELDAYAAGRGAPNILGLGSATLYLPPQRTGAGAFAAALFQRLAGSAAGDLQANVMQATKETLDKFGVTSLPADLGGTGFAALDRNGQAVACAVTMNGAFGAGKLVEGTGILLARSPSSGQVGLASAFLTPAIALNGSSVSLAGAGAGGSNGTAAIAFAISKLTRGESVTRAGDIRSTGMAPYDTVNAIVCQEGVCAPLSDPGASGLGASANGR